MAAHDPKTFYLTTPLYYPNARPHVGSAYTTIVCDIVARYKRMCGYDVAFLTGTDEHGEKLERAAAAAGMSPREFVAEKRKLFTELWKKLGIAYDYFIYTDQPDHVTSVQRMLRLAKENEPGVIEKRRYEGRYCISDERYVSDGPEPANCDICGRPAELITEENYFFKLSAFQDRLLEHYEKSPEFVQPDFRMNEVKSFVRGGLRDISVSRQRIKWGIPWPDDPEQVFYVWYDALTGYMTGIGYAEGDRGSATFKKYWRNDDSGYFAHMIGKDILRFHAVYWPAFLMAAREPLPKTVFAHGWIYYEQDKMSKSKGNVVYPEPIVDALDSFGAPGNDALRYYLLREAPFGHDTSFSYDALVQRYNSDLANDLGNLASRTVTMLNRYFGGTVPEHAPDAAIAKGPSLRVDSNAAAVEFRRCFEDYNFSNGLDAVWRVISETNRYLVDTEPWAKAEDPNQRQSAADSLYTAAETLRFVAILLYPTLPVSMQKLWRLLGQPGKVQEQSLDDLAWGGTTPGTKVGKSEPIFPRLDKAKTLAKLEELAELDRERDQPKGATVTVESDVPAPERQSAVGRAQSAVPSPESRAPSPAEGQSAVGRQPSAVLQADSSSSPAPQNDNRSASPTAQSSIADRQSAIQKISIDDFARVEMVVGQIVSAEAIPGAKKLLKLQVDIGSEVRQVAAGIAEHYRPEELAGMKIVLVANLEPRKLRGVESNGMVVAASIGPEGKPVLATFKEDVPNGTRLK